MNTIWGAVVVGGVLLLGARAACADDPVLPTVPVEGLYVGGGSPICTGPNCLEALLFGNQAYNDELWVAQEPLPPEPETRKEVFCAKLEELQPEDCDVNASPSTPMFNSSWQPNGCGPGGWKQPFVDYLYTQAVPWTGGTSLDNPSLGLDFTAACNGHDSCWGNNGARGQCDIGLFNDIGGVCSGSSNPLCDDLQALYYYAVSSTAVGDAAYATVTEALVCDAYRHDWKTNCEED